MKKRHLKKRKQQQNIASERMEILFDLAEKEALARDFKRAARYVELARKIGKKYNIPLKQYRLKFCNKCGAFLIPSLNSRVRTSGKKLVITCLECDNTARRPFHREVKERRSHGQTS